MRVSRANIVWICLFLGACAAPPETQRSARRTPAPQSLQYAAAVDEVRTAQLYAGRENALPIFQLGSGIPLTLEFDLMGRQARPLSVYFYHADRLWRRDLSRSEYLLAFHRDDLFDYVLSTNTQLSYTHYTYDFPNSSIGFRLSGNYILRVAEQGREDAVLFERPFYVAESLGPVSLDLQNLLTGQQAMPTIQPLLSYTPPPQLTGAVFDYSVCFIRNGEHKAARCSQQPNLSAQPDLLFFLEPEEAFRPQEGDFYMDLRRLQPGGQVERISFVSSPYEVFMQPDYARFPSTSVDPLLSGQSVISRAHTYAGDPDTHGEYARVQFRYVPPDEARLPGGVYIVGSFNGWSIDLGRELRWDAEKRRYEGTLLIKQGEYEYRYTSPDPSVRRALRARLPRVDNQYTALVYFRDLSFGTDRLLAFQHVFSR